jgi:NADH dehydrogenase/NADH:ubiquinone oxidoreductase subunit G
LKGQQEVAEQKASVKLSIDGVEVSVPAGSTLIQAAEKLGKNIPHFCYHPGLPVVGQCRMCFVEIEGAPKLATACSTPAAENMKVLTASEKVKQGQNATLEFTLLNHPLDCPICDRGGECKLQDYTYEYGPPLSRMYDDKVQRLKHHPVSEQVILDQERCILCTRCIRFSADVDGRAELVVNNRGNADVIDVFNNKPMQSRFSGNVVDLCPVGALTAKDFRFEARPWELKRHNAVCTGCSVGCNIEIHTKHRHQGIPRPDGSHPNPKIERLIPRDNLEINQWWMCDKGRWGYHFSNDDKTRLTQPLARRTQGGAQAPVSLREIQVLIDERTKGFAGTWEFWIDDSMPLEGIAWAKEIRESWVSRGRKVERMNPASQGDALLKFYSSRSNHAWVSGKPDWSKIKKIVSPYSDRELEDITPILALRLGQAFRKGQLQWEKRNFENSFASSDDTATTAYLVPAPTNDKALGVLSKASSEANILVLWTQANSRGLVNEGIAPVESTAASLKGKSPQGPVFFFGQRTQNVLNSDLAEYLARAPFVIVADSFATSLSERADVVLPVMPLYESESTLTSLENHRQFSKGIHVEHPNVPDLHRGGPLVNPSLRLL